MKSIVGASNFPDSRKRLPHFTDEVRRDLIVTNPSIYA